MVNTDGGGAGSQGRAFDEQPQPDTSDSQPSDADQNGITSDDDGQMHLDITA